MNTSHAAHVGPNNLHPAGTRPAHLRIVLLVLYAALVAQLAIWSSLAARVSLTAAFTQPHRGTESDVVVGGAVWLIVFTMTGAGATSRYGRYNR
jgi:hypothetical protein